MSTKRLVFAGIHFAKDCGIMSLTELLENKVRLFIFILPQKRAGSFSPSAGSKRFTLGEGLTFDWNAALREIEQFISVLWTGTRSPAQKYIQESGLPVILTKSADGTYANAMTSDDDMDALIGHLGYQVDQAANMDW